MIRIAAHLFRTRGFHATSMNDISREMGIRKSSIYYYIKSKDDLLFDISRITTEMLIPVAEEAAFSDLEPEKKLRLIIDNHVKLIAENFDFFFTSLHELQSLTERKQEVLDIRDRYERLVRGIIRSGIQNGTFRDIDVKIATFTLLGMMNWMIRWYHADGPISYEEIADIFSEIFINGIKKVN